MKITVKTFYTHVETDDYSILERLDRHFAIPIPNFWFSDDYKSGRWDGRRHFFSASRGRILSGLLDRLVSFCVDNGISYQIEDLRSPIDKDVEIVTQFGKFDVTSPDYDYQYKTVKVMLEHGSGVAEVATNGGKTVIAASLIASLKKKTLFIVGIKEQLYQAADFFKRYMPDTEVGIYGAGYKERKELTVAMIQSLYSIASKNWFKDFEVIIFDEAHHVPAETFSKVALKCPARYRFGLSGTAFDGNPVRDYVLIGHTGESLIKVTNAELIARGVSAVPKIVFSYSAGNYLSNVKTYHNAVSKGLTKNDARNEQIAELVKKLRSEGENILIISAYTTHCNRLHMLLEGEVDPLYMSTGQVPDFVRERNMEMFREDGGVMIASTVYDEGVSFPDINSLILVSGQKKERKFLQRVGRALRKKKGENIVKIFDFIDWLHKYLENHTIQRLALYLSEGFEVVGIDADSQAWVDERTLEFNEHKIDEPVDEQKENLILKKKKQAYKNNPNVKKNLIRQKYLKFKNGA